MKWSVKARSYLVNEWHEECVRDEARDVLGRCYLYLSSFRHKYQLSSKLRKKLTFPTSSRERTRTVKRVFRRLECGDELHEFLHGHKHCVQGLKKRTEFTMTGTGLKKWSPNANRNVIIPDVIVKRLSHVPTTLLALFDPSALEAV